MRVFIVVFIVLVILQGCSGITSSADQPSRPPPTIAPFFSGGTQPLPPISLPTTSAGPVIDVDPPLSEAASLQATAQRDASDDVVREVTIYDDQLDERWNLENSWDVRLNPQSRVFVASGFSALEVTPLDPLAGLLLVNTERSGITYPREDVLGVRFYITGGPNYLSPDNLIVRMFGSNRYPYFVENDNSVRPDRDPTSTRAFAEVTLDRLGLRRDLAPGEWAELELWFEGYDISAYTYVTGINIMNSSSYMGPFYIDKISLIYRRS